MTIVDIYKLVKYLQCQTVRGCFSRELVKIALSETNNFKGAGYLTSQAWNTHLPSTQMMTKVIVPHPGCMLMAPVGEYRVMRGHSSQKKGDLYVQLLTNENYFTCAM